MSTDEEFVDELKSSIRFIVAVLLRRAKKVRFVTFIKLSVGLRG